MQCLIDLEVDAKRSEAKMELVTIANDLMPAGQPKYTDVIKHPMIRQWVEREGKKKMLAIMVLLVKDFCSSMNVVRNMNEDQMIEAGAMLLEECGNFRVEDYVMMFSMAKRGNFHPEVKIYDRIDLQVISSIMDEYWKKRRVAGQQARDQDVEFLENSGENPADRKTLSWNGKDYEEQADMAGQLQSFAGALSSVVSEAKDQFADLDATELKKDRRSNPDYRNPHPNPAFNNSGNG